MPGVLPVLNRKVVDYTLKMALATGCAIAPVSRFARKNYFYPDLPKGYQISQYELPMAEHGHIHIEIDGKKKRIGITRAHLEEDAGKSLHEDFAGMTGVDLNRAGTPLLEIVSDPDMRSGAEAVAYMRKIHSIVTYIGICDGNMSEGSFRCDVNISMRPKGQEEFGTRAEIKNLNSFRAVRKALAYEADRQARVLRDGGKVVHETLLWDESRERAVPMRSKEGASDYRYFPEPDLIDFDIDGRRLERVRESMPELPGAARHRDRPPGRTEIRVPDSRHPYAREKVNLFPTNQTRPGRCHRPRPALQCFAPNSDEAYQADEDPEEMNKHWNRTYPFQGMGVCFRVFS